ncbi:VanZ family protein [Streptomyces sp. NPDC004980]
MAVAFLGLVAFSVVLAKITLTPSPASEDLVTSNLQPGRSLRQYAEDYTFLAACKQAGGNLLLGAPFGVLLPIMVPRRLRMIRMVLLTVLVMSVVELTQGALVAGRAFDIDDVILNTSGALLGYALIGRRISHRYHTLSDEPPAAEPAKAPPAAKAGATRTTIRTEVARKARAGTKAVRAGRSGTGSKPRAGSKAGSAGSKTGSGGKAGSGGRSASAAKSAPGRTSGESGASTRRSAPAPIARGRALFDRWRSRRPGPGGGAPGAGRRGN